MKKLNKNKIPNLSDLLKSGYANLNNNKYILYIDLI